MVFLRKHKEFNHIHLFKRVVVIEGWKVADQEGDLANGYGR